MVLNPNHICPREYVAMLRSVAVAEKKDGMKDRGEPRGEMMFCLVDIGEIRVYLGPKVNEEEKRELMDRSP